MSRASPANLPASVRHRLLNLAKSRGEELQAVLTQYGIERLLYRLAHSDVKNRFVLKGAMLFQIWEGGARRPTRDVDFLGYGDASAEGVVETFRSLCRIEVQADGLIFHEASVRAEAIRDMQDYGGVRLTLTAMLGTARIPLQVDVGFGDAVTPGVETATFPTLLDFPAPTIRVYPPETVIAEKYQAMVSLGIVNTRMKDFYDVNALAEDHAFDGATLASAIVATFARRDTPLPSEPPVALTQVFGDDRAKQGQWRAFRTRSRLSDAPPELATVTERLRAFLWPPTEAARNSQLFDSAWLPSIGWNADRG
jgi:predicted nucleotidyltransferase component of viral defense system